MILVTLYFHETKYFKINLKMLGVISNIDLKI